MTLSAPIGCISKAEERLRNMLAACVPLQQWMGVSTAGEAKERIYLLELPPPSIDDEERDGTFTNAEITSRRPFVIIWTPSDRPFTIDVIAYPGSVTANGVLRARFEENVPDELINNYAEAYRRFLNTMGRILHSEEPVSPGMVELLSQCRPGDLAFRQINVLDHMRTHDDDVPTLGDAHKCEIEVVWGVSQ